MRIVIVIRQYGSYSEQWLKRQIQLLSSKDLLILMTSPSDCDVPEKLRMINIGRGKDLFKRIWDFIFPKDYRLDLRRRFRHAVREFSPDVIIFHYVDFALNFAEEIGSLRIKTFIHCHGYDITWSLRSHSKPDVVKHKDDYQDRVRNISNYATFIANSRFTQCKLEEIGIAREKIKMKYFGVPQKEMRRKPEVFTISYIGRLVDFKGPDRVIEAFNLACDQGLIAQLIVAGDGPLRSYIELLKRRSKYSEWISIIGKIEESEVERIYNSTSVFTAHNCKGELSTQEEAFGVTIIEAMSYGIPVVTGRSGAVIETVIHNETGILFTPYSVKEHAKALLDLYNDEQLLEKLSLNALNHVREHFSEKREKEALLKIFQDEHT